MAPADSIAPSRPKPVLAEINERLAAFTVDQLSTVPAILNPKPAPVDREGSVGVAIYEIRRIVALTAELMEEHQQLLAKMWQLQDDLSRPDRAPDFLRERISVRGAARKQEQLRQAQKDSAFMLDMHDVLKGLFSLEARREFPELNDMSFEMYDDWSFGAVTPKSGRDIFEELFGELIPDELRSAFDFHRRNAS